jgi:hypothetical protein
MGFHLSTFQQERPHLKKQYKLAWGQGGAKLKQGDLENPSEN